MTSKDEFFEVLKHAYDHNRWNKQKELVSAIADIKQNTLNEYISALDFLEKELGKGFLKSSSNNHPIKQMIANKANWQIQELIQLVDTLRKLKLSDSNYLKLIQKILGREKSKSEGIPFIEIARSFLKEDFYVRFPDETNIGKSPDIEILNIETNDRLFIEVSMVNESEERDLISSNYRFLLNQFVFVTPISLFTCKQKQKIPKDNYPRIMQIISDSKMRIVNINEIITYSDEQFEFTLAPFEMIDKLKTICKMNGTQLNYISGLNLKFDETDRLIKNKIKVEARQIPLENNGLIYFHVNPTFFITTDFENLIARIQDYIKKFTNILGIVIYTKSLNQKEDFFVEFDRHCFGSKMFEDVLCKQLIFIYNHQCEIKLTEKTIEKIYSTFKK
jgi:hypothetical protein